MYMNFLRSDWLLFFSFLTLTYPPVIPTLILTRDGESHPQSYGVPASMLPPLPSGRVLKLFTSPNSGLLGARVWPAAYSLCSYLLENRQSFDLRNAKCVELGSGTGAVGLFAAALGANVVLTDCRPPPNSAMYTTDGTSSLPEEGCDGILQLLEENVDINKDIFPNFIPLVMELDWTNPTDIEKVAEEGDYDIVLASDVTHFSLMHEPLATMIARLMRKDGGICLLSHQERMVNLRGNDLQLSNFCQVAESSGLHVEHLPCPPSQTLPNGFEDISQNDSRQSMLLIRHVETDSPLLHGVGGLK